MAAALPALREKALKSQYVNRVSLIRDKVDSFDRYPFSLPSIRSLEQINLHPKITFFVGENGSGKSTLLEAIAVSLGFNAEGGTRNFRFGTRHSHSDLHEYLRIAKGIKKPRDGFFLRAESFFNVATEIDISRVAYEDTEHYQVTRDFLANPERMLRVLLER